MLQSVLLVLGLGSPEPNILGPVVPLLKILSMCVVGVIIAQPRIGILNPQCCKTLSKLVFALFFPCLIFTELGKAISPQNVRDWWFIPVNVLISSTVGCLFGVIVALVCRPPPQYFRLTVVMTGIGNTGNLPLSIIGSVCHGWNPFGPGCKRAGVAYVSFAQWVSVIIIYVFVYHMLEPPKGYYCFEDEDAQDVLQSADDTEITPAEAEAQTDGQYVLLVNEEESMPDLVEAEWPGVKDARNEHTLTPFLSRIFRMASFNESSPTAEALQRAAAAGTTPSSSLIISESGDDTVGCLKEPRMVRKMRIVVERTPIRHMMQPPALASLLAILVGSVSGLSSILFDEDAPLEFVTDALTILGNAMVPSVLLVLGGMFSGGPAKSELGMRTIIGICFTRLVVLPLVGIGVVLAAKDLGFTPANDPMFHFVLLLQHTMPTSILMAGMTSLRGFGESEASSVLFWQHIVSIVPLSGFIAIYFRYLLPQ